MRQPECRLSRSPGARRGQETFPIVHLTQEVLESKNRCQCHHDKLGIHNGYLRTLCLFLGAFQECNVLRDSIRLLVVGLHARSESEHVDGMETSAVFIQVSHEFQGSELCVEGVGVL